MAALSAGELVYGRAAAELAGAKGVGSLDASSIWRSSPGRGFLLGNGQTTWEFNGRVFTSESEYIQGRIAAFRAQQTAGSIDTIPPGQRLIRPPYYDAQGPRVPIRTTSGSGLLRGQPEDRGPAHITSHRAARRRPARRPIFTSVMVRTIQRESRLRFRKRDMARRRALTMLTTGRQYRQRRFDEEYLDRLLPPDVRYRSPRKRQRPVDQEKWDKVQARLWVW